MKLPIIFGAIDPQIYLIIGLVPAILTALGALYFRNRETNQKRDDTEYDRLSKAYATMEARVMALEARADADRVKYDKMSDENIALRKHNLELTNQISNLERRLTRNEKATK